MVHGTWFGRWAAGEVGYSRFIFWGEVTPTASALRPRRSTRAPSSHPYPLPQSDLRRHLGRTEGEAVLRTGQPLTVLLDLPTAAGVPLPSPDLALPPEMLADLATAPVRRVPWPVVALGVDAAAALPLLQRVSTSAPGASFRGGADLDFWMHAARLALHIVAGGRFLPDLAPVPSGPGRLPDRWAAAWQPDFGDDEVEDRVQALAATMPEACRAPSGEEPRYRGYLYEYGHGLPVRPARPDADTLLREFLAAAVQGLARQALPSSGGTAPQRGQGNPPAAWLDALADSAGPLLESDFRSLKAFKSQADRWLEGPQAYRASLRLIPPGAEGEPWRIAFELQANDDPSLFVPAEEVWALPAGAQQLLGRRLSHPHERLRQALALAAQHSTATRRALMDPEPRGAELSPGEAVDFIHRVAPLLAAEGLGVVVPRLAVGLALRVSLRRGTPAPRPGHGPTSAGLGWDRLVDVDWTAALGGQPVDLAELDRLARLKEPLVQFRGQWVEFNPREAERALALAREHGADGRPVDLLDALRLTLGEDLLDPAAPGSLSLAVEHDRWFDDLLARIGLGSHPRTPRERSLQEPPTFRGVLRPYQREALAWMAALRDSGLGACLALDMGLGKSPTTIALRLHALARPEPDRPWLIVSPTSVVANWRRELERFAPGLRVLVHHGPERRTEEFSVLAGQHHVVLSSYALLPRDAAHLREVHWGAVVLDEAQNVKNSTTQAAQAARSLTTDWRLALTGTPIENRLADLWSLFAFLAPGYLGSARAFRAAYASPIERAEPGADALQEQLRRLVAPFILRRLKSDKEIIADLPEKTEMQVYCSLTREQATLYQATLRTSLEGIDTAQAGLERRGRILATLTRLKQVCNHPVLLLKDGSRLAGRSGKLNRLGEMLEEALAEGDRALVFTQYAEMGFLLQSHLSSTLGSEVLFLHGAVPARKRQQMVQRFQEDPHGPPIFILSLKAGGTGLNLTRANRVFHVDRWWNPAVENQASDRAYRIGQDRAVLVHKFICAGTLEEALDDLITRKLALAESVVGQGESWITELGTDQIRSLFALRPDAAVEG